VGNSAALCSVINSSRGVHVGGALRLWLSRPEVRGGHAAHLNEGPKAGVLSRDLLVETVPLRSAAASFGRKSPYNPLGHWEIVCRRVCEPFG